MSPRTPRTPRKKGGLGKGIGALMSSSPSRTSVPIEVPIDQVHPDPDQPRKRFDEHALNELSASIRQQGILQPILVQTLPSGGYQIIAGERRWQAAQRAGLRRISIIEKAVNSQEAFELALLENLQRQDLTPIEESRSYARLADEFGLSTAEIALKMGKSESAVKNALRLLKLSLNVISLIDEGHLSAGHGKILVSLPTEQQDSLAQHTITHQWSVRALESKVAQLKEEAKDSNPVKNDEMDQEVEVSSEERSKQIDQLQAALSEELKRKVKIKMGKRGGQVVLRFKDDEDLKVLSEFLGQKW